MKLTRQKVGKVLSKVDDQELVILAQNDRQDAFVEIVTRYQNLVVGVAFSILQDFVSSDDLDKGILPTILGKDDQLLIIHLAQHLFNPLPGEFHPFNQPDPRSRGKVTFF